MNMFFDNEYLRQIQIINREYLFLSHYFFGDGSVWIMSATDIFAGI